MGLWFRVSGLGFRVFGHSGVRVLGGSFVALVFRGLCVWVFFFFLGGGLAVRVKV